jgi:diguanylate cyclase (GGDEF)-like protein
MTTRSFHRDGTTGVLNRRAFMSRVYEEMNVERPLGLVVLELDGLQAIHDHRGTAVADRVLAEAAERLESVTRVVDSCGRTGPAALAWVLPDVSGTELVDAVSQLRERIATTPFADGIRVTATIDYLACA